MASYLNIFNLVFDDFLGSVLRITCTEGPQAGDLNFWNASNYEERFYTGKTRQLHRSHLSLYDKLWSCFPYLNPMATIVGDSIQYGLDEGRIGELYHPKRNEI